jgi:hypothetical protein
MGKRWLWKKTKSEERGEERVKYIYIVMVLLAGILFLVDPFGWMTMPEVGKECSPMSLYPRCTGKINFF